MVFQGLDEARREAVWRPFFDWLAERAADYDFASGTARRRALPGAALLGRRLPEGECDGVRPQRRPARRAGGQRVLGEQPRRGRLVPARLRVDVDAGAAARARQPGAAGRCAVRGARGTGASRCTSTRGWPARRPRRSRRRATRRRIRRRSTPSRSPSAPAKGRRPIPGIAGHEPDVALAPRATPRTSAAAHGRAAQAGAEPRLLRLGEQLLRARLARAFWGANYARLRQVKDKYDPDGLFFVHHGVGSEDWSPDGFTRL